MCYRKLNFYMEMKNYHLKVNVLKKLIFLGVNSILFSQSLDFLQNDAICSSRSVEVMTRRDIYPLGRQTQLLCRAIMLTAWIRMRCRVTQRLTRI